MCMSLTDYVYTLRCLFALFIFCLYCGVHACVYACSHVYGTYVYRFMCIQSPKANIQCVFLSCYLLYLLRQASVAR